MQTLNVGAGQTDEDYKKAEGQRRDDLLADSRSDANYFFWAAGLADRHSPGTAEHFCKHWCA
jgi:hypothetical protein